MNYNTDRPEFQEYQCEADRIKSVESAYPFLKLKLQNQKTLQTWPSWNRLLGSGNAGMLLNQIVFWSRNNYYRPFYKFQKPCNNSLCKYGDTWLEELGLNERAFSSALKKIATRIQKGMSKWDVLNSDATTSLVLYWVDRDGLTWYQLNYLLFERFEQIASEFELDNLSQKPITSIGYRIDRSQIAFTVNTSQIPSSTTTENTNINYGEVENFEVSDQTGNLPDSENSPDQDQTSSLAASFLRSGFVSRNENNSQQAVKGSKSNKKPSLVKIMEAIPIKTKRVSQAIAEIFIEEDIYDWGLISDEIWKGIKTWPNYQNGDRTPEQKVKHYLSGITRLGKCDQIAEALRQACEAVRAKKHPIESKSDSPTNLSSEQKIALKQIHLALKRGNRSLAQQIASEHGLN